MYHSVSLLNLEVDLIVQLDVRTNTLSVPSTKIPVLLGRNSTSSNLLLCLPKKGSVVSLKTEMIR